MYLSNFLILNGTLCQLSFLTPYQQLNNKFHFLAMAPYNLFSNTAVHLIEPYLLQNQYILGAGQDYNIVLLFVPEVIKIFWNLHTELPSSIGTVRSTD